MFRRRAAQLPNVWLRLAGALDPSLERSDHPAQPADSLEISSSTRRTFSIRTLGANGFCRKAVLGPRPAPRMISSLYPDIYMTFIPGRSGARFSANWRPFIFGIT